MRLISLVIVSLFLCGATWFFVPSGSSGTAPEDLTGIQHAWHQTFTTSGSDVATWADEVAGGQDWSACSNAPGYTASDSEINNKPSMQLPDAASECLSATAASVTSPFVSGSAGYAFWLGKIVGADIVQYLFKIDTTGGYVAYSNQIGNAAFGTLIFGILGDGLSEIIFNQYVGATPIDSRVTDWHLVFIQYSGGTASSTASWNLYINGTDESSGLTTRSSIGSQGTLPTVGLNGIAGNRELAGELAVLGFGTGTLSSSERDSLTEWINAEYGTSF